MKLGDIVRCMGEGDSLYVIIDENDLAFYFAGVSGCDAGWKSKENAIPLSKSALRDKQRAAQKVVDQIEELLSKKNGFDN